MCRWGFSNIITTLNSVTDERVRAYIVWLPIYEGRFKGEAQKLSNSYRNPRVSYVLDERSETATEWQSVLGTPSVAWDVYMLFGPDSKWETRPPQPAFWMHQLSGVSSAPRLDEKVFTSKLMAMVHDMKQSGISAQPAGRAKVELLYFKSCPNYEQALRNLRAALKELNIEADIDLTLVNSETEAMKVGFQGSPSIRVNGKDIDGQNEGSSYSCRVYNIDGKFTATPSKEFIKARLRQLLR